VEVVRECAPRRRAAFHNDVPLSIAALVGLLPTVIFLPQEMTLFSGPPAERRRFLDQLLSQADASYVPAFSAYQRVLKQRTALLHRIADGECSAVDLDAWDRELAIKGALLTAARLHVLSVWETQLLAMLRELGEAWDGARFHYERKTCGHAADVIANELFASLVAVRDRDLALRATTVGPHREDWHMIVEDRSLPRFASRGQERVAVVALLLLAVRYLHAQRGEHPVLLFDDVFSELDDAHQRALLERLTGCQVLMTAVRMPEEANRAVLWRMREGQWSTDSVESS
jgi:DNA replication and repair protein RecF